LVALYFKVLKPFLLKRERNSRARDDEAFQKLKDKEGDNFNVALGNRRVEGLRDLNYNNIFDLVAAGGWIEDKRNIDWTVDMTKIVLPTIISENIPETKNVDCEAAGKLEIAKLCVPNKEEVYQ